MTDTTITIAIMVRDTLGAIPATMPATGTHSVIGAWASLAGIVGGVLLFAKRRAS